jgi:dihydropteroate synthase
VGAASPGAAPSRLAELLAGDRHLVMGVLNLTPDSFFDGGRYESVPEALAQALAMQRDGADIIDLGGESTRPGAQPVSAQQELDRVIPVVEALRAETDLPISVDTSKADVMDAAVAAGASMINDVRALRGAGALAAAARLRVPVCLMHMQGEPRTMQAEPRYEDVVVEVARFLRERALAAEDAGVPAGMLIVDPGFGFGKTVAHNLELLRELGQMAALGYPVLVGLSRKSMLGKLTDRPVEERLAGSVTLNVLAAQRGAKILRVHDVAPTVDALRILAAFRN